MEKVFRHTHPYTTDTDIARAEHSNAFLQRRFRKFFRLSQKRERIRYSVAEL